MNKEKNTYIIIYASVMVILTALILASVSEYLRPSQLRNKAIDKKRQILASLNIASTGKNAEKLYSQMITDTYTIDEQGNKIEGDAFETDLAVELEKKEGKRYPVFEASVDNQKKYVLSMRGAGLWGPIWGFISLDNDKNTVFGASFGHESETPGLGAEIEKPFFAHEFRGKKIFNDKLQFTSIAIVKPGKTVAGKDYVDGISGGTITSKGVDAMLYSNLEFYVPYLIKTDSDVQE
ncbi:MAG: NADH:ubiquinone reductase (Na(+)-transporting) subunit C [Dysgonamonadaceae bacterium]|nr:NADH:ubiquinone reductase (Na(+)-transporting) subunit C [Dysgonamonadaceae bacterium]